MSNEKGNAPLHLAVKAGHLPTIKWLLQAEPFINIKDSRGNTPLLLAAQESSTSIVEELLKDKAETDMTNLTGTPRDMAYSSNTWIAYYIETVRPILPKTDSNKKH